MKQRISSAYRHPSSYPCSIVDERIRFPETEKISPPLLQMSEVTFGYTTEKIILNGVSFDVGLDSRIAIVGANGSGKSTLFVVSADC